MPKHILVPLIVASALFLQQIDATALATSLPAIGEALGETPVRVHLAITAYMFSLAAFVPVSGWVADRFGARHIFRLAMAIFTLSSLACGFADSLTWLIVARICQGVGGAMMVPVGRLILVRSVGKSELVGALAMMSMPALIGPILGPLVGGFLTTYASWRWIFWVNLPVGIIGILLVTIFIPNVEGEARRRFDPVGVMLISFGLSALLFGIDAAATQSASEVFAFACLGLGALSTALYVGHAGRRDEPVLDLSLLRIDTFRASMTGGSLFRLCTGAMPFLLPLLFQVGFGYTPAESGSITFISAVGSLGMRTISSRVLRRFGFRSVLIWDGLIATFFMAVCIFIRPGLPHLVILATLFFGGLFRSLQLMSLNALAFADLDGGQMSHGTALSTMAQRLSQSLGVALSAFILHVTVPAGGLPSFFSFDLAFLAVALLALLSLPVFMGLRRDAGAELSGRAA
jgi:EmrB/QacA subfamily drug resistance transporter